MTAKKYFTLAAQSMMAMSMLPAGSAYAGCSFTGLCGTISFLGRTADNANAVFLVQTTTPGTFSVVATEGGASGPVDVWQASGPGSHVVVSPFPASYGGTHILNSQVISPGEYVASAYQGPTGKVFPVGYVSADSRPAATVVHVVGSNVVQTASVNQAQPPQVAQPQQQVVEVQMVAPVLHLPDPVVGPPTHITVSQPVAVPSLQQPGPTSVSQPQTPVIAPPSQQTTLISNPPMRPPNPQAPVNQAGGNPSVAIVQTPPPQPVVIHGVQQPGPTSVTHPQTPVIAPPSQQTTLISNPPMRQPNPQVPVTPAGGNTPVTVVHIPPVQTPIVVTSQPQPVLLDKQNNPGATVGPSGQFVTIQAVRQPVPESVTNPQTPVILPPTQQNTLVAVQTVPSNSHQLPMTQPGNNVPVTVVQSPQNVLPGTTQSKLQLPTLPDGTNRSEATALPSAMNGIANACTPVKNTVQPNGVDVTCKVVNQPRWVVWADARNQKTSDQRPGINQKGFHQVKTMGIEYLTGGKYAYGLSIGTEKDSGTVFGELAKYETNKTSLGPYVKYTLNDRWTATAGLSYARESTSAEVLSVSGRYKADHYGALLALSGFFADADSWRMPAIYVTRNVVRNHSGQIHGVVDGRDIAVQSPASSERSGAITASYDVGRKVYAQNGVSFELYGQVAAHYDYSRGASSPWSGDVRAGLRMKAPSDVTVDVSLSRFGIMNNVNNKEIRLTVLKAF